MSRKKFNTPALPAAEGKDIIREGLDGFAMYFDGIYIGSRSSRLQAETTLDAYVYDLLCDEAVESANIQAELAESYAEQYINDQASIDQPVSPRDAYILRSLAGRFDNDITADRIPCTDQAHAALNQQLAHEGLRLAGSDEQGWTYLLVGGVRVWVTDAPAVSWDGHCKEYSYRVNGLVRGYEQFAEVAARKAVLAQMEAA